MPFLLGTDTLYDTQLDKFVKLKKKNHDADWVGIINRYSIPDSVRADPLWAKVVRRAKPDDCGYICRYVLIPSQFSQYMDIIKYDGSETCRINFEKYGMGAIRKILDDVSLNDAERIEKIKGVYAFIEANKDMKPFI